MDKGTSYASLSAVKLPFNRERPVAVFAALCAIAWNCYNRIEKGLDNSPSHGTGLASNSCNQCLGIQQCSDWAWTKYQRLPVTPNGDSNLAAPEKLYDVFVRAFLIQRLIQLCETGLNRHGTYQCLARPILHQRCT
jgi:hypothetical protein